jgi:hypothetical protein
MNFLEAYEANKENKVRVGDHIYEKNDLSSMPSFCILMIKGEWEIIKEPRVIWINEFKNGRMSIAELSKITGLSISYYNGEPPTKVSKWIEVIE